MNDSHFANNKLSKLVSKALNDVGSRLETLKPIRSLVLFEKPSDRLFNPEARLPFQAFWSTETAESLFEGLRKGLDEREACAWARISPSIVQKWMKAGQAGMEPYRSFVLDWEHALVKCKMDHFDMLENANPEAKATTILKSGRLGKHLKDNAKQTTVVVEDKRSQYNELTDEEKAAKMRVLLYGNQPEQRMIVEAKVVEENNA